LAGADCALISLDDRSIGIMSPCKMNGSLAMGVPVVYAGPTGSNVDDAITEYACGFSLRQGDVTGLVDAIAEHQLRMADRAGTSVVLLFLRFDDHRTAIAGGDPGIADRLAAEAAEVLISAIRDSDLPARIADDTFCVLLSGDAKGSEVAVLSRLVEAIALHDANEDDPKPLALSVGSAIYDPANPISLEGLLRTAEAEMRPHASETR
jgi:diguanylate cyclase (GGDEF)-like protein